MYVFMYKMWLVILEIEYTSAFDRNITFHLGQNIFPQPLPRRLTAMLPSDDSLMYIYRLNT